MGDEWNFDFGGTSGGGNAQQVANRLSDSLSIQLRSDRVEYIRPTSANITADQMLDSVINNYGQGSVDNIQNLPPAAANLRATFDVGTDPGGTYIFGFRAYSGDKIYLDGTGGSDGNGVYIEPTVGDKIVVEAFQTGATSWDWIAITHHGTWTTATFGYTRILTTGDRRVTTVGDVRILA
jgi:hypothetical protein